MDQSSQASNSEVQSLHIKSTKKPLYLLSEAVPFSLKYPLLLYPKYAYLLAGRHSTPAFTRIQEFGISKFKEGIHILCTFSSKSLSSPSSLFYSSAAPTQTIKSIPATTISTQQYTPFQRASTQLQIPPCISDTSKRQAVPARPSSAMGRRYVWAPSEILD